VKLSRPALLIHAALVLCGCGGGDPAAPSDDGSGGAAEDGSGGAGGRQSGTGGTPQGGRGGGMPDAAGAGGMNASEGGKDAGEGGAGTADGGPSDIGGGSDAAGATGGTAGSGGPKKQWSCPPGPFEAPKAGASKTICAGLTKYNWSEGPTWIASQNAFFFSNFVVMKSGPGNMLKYTPSTDTCELFIEGNGCNGLAVGPDGSILAACQTPRALLRYDPVTKAKTVLLDKVEGKMLDSVNDLVVHSNGTIYFTNTTYELAGRPQGLGTAAVRIDPMGVVSVIAHGMVNGIALSPDERRLYIVFMGVYDLDELGVPGKKTGGFPLSNDGLGIDCAGNVYGADGSIHSPTGAALGNFGHALNMAFGGPDGKTMLVVGRGPGARIVDMNVPGLP
jgi:gluconolactonase